MSKDGDEEFLISKGARDRWKNHTQRLDKFLSRKDTPSQFAHLDFHTVLLRLRSTLWARDHRFRVFAAATHNPLHRRQHDARKF